MWQIVTEHVCLNIPHHTALNIVGLGLDVIGVVLIFIFALPADVRRGGASFLMLDGEDADEKRKAKRYDLWARLGLILLVSGFLLQIASSISQIEVVT